MRVFVGSRALSSHGFHAVGLARVPARYRDKPRSEPELTLWHGVLLPEQEKYFDRYQRGQELENLGRSCCNLDPKGAQNLYRRRLAVGSEEHGLCLGLQRHRLVHEFFPWALFRSTKSAVKIHTLLDLRGAIPTFINFSDGKTHDTKVLVCWSLKPEPST